MRRLLVTLLVMLACQGLFASPPEALAVSLADTRAFAKEDTVRFRYQDMTQWPPQERLAKVGQINLILNSLSKRRQVGRPTLLGTDAQVLRIDLADYGLWGSDKDPNAGQKVYERLGTPEAQEPYFHRLKEEAYTDAAGKKSTRRINAHGTWLDPAAIKELSERTFSYVPIVRADWFIFQASQQADRVTADKKGFGYYDFLNVKTQQDFFDLGGADPKKAKQLQMVIAARMGRSGVARNNRGIARQQCFTGGLWVTADFKTSKDRQNVLRLLRDEAHPPQGDASEQYITLPNGLFAYGLFDAQGNRQDTVPDFIAGDPRGIGLDTRIHAGRSCIACHVEGLRPIDDFVRKVITGQAELRPLNKGLALDLEELYLNNLPAKLHTDNEVFKAALKEVNGLTPEDNAQKLRALLSDYLEADVTMEKASFELGLTEQGLRDTLEKYVKDAPGRKALGDPLLVGLAKRVSEFSKQPSIPLRREHFEELVPVIYDMVQGAIP